jgi:hypothetical protein
MNAGQTLKGCSFRPKPQCDQQGFGIANTGGCYSLSRATKVQRLTYPLRPNELFAQVAIPKVGLAEYDSQG